MNNNAFGFLIGLGAGVGLGIMLAPRSGERTRSLLQAKANEGATVVRQRASEVMDGLADTVREGTRTVAKQTEAVRAAMDAGKHAYGQAIRS
jgi:gas vesicle protein